MQSLPSSISNPGRATNSHTRPSEASATPGPSPSVSSTPNQRSSSNSGTPPPTKKTAADRTRNVYTITAEGREALGEWTSTRTQPPRLEVEALLRLLFADHGSREDLLGALDELESDIGEHHQAIVELMASYLDGGHPFPQRTHLSVLFATFQIEMFKTIERWIEFARDEIDEWPTTQDLGMTPRTETLTRLLADDQSPVNP